MRARHHPENSNDYDPFFNKTRTRWKANRARRRDQKLGPMGTMPIKPISRIPTVEPKREIKTRAKPDRPPPIIDRTPVPKMEILKPKPIKLPNQKPKIMSERQNPETDKKMDADPSASTLNTITAGANTKTLVIVGTIFVLGMAGLAYMIHQNYPKTVPIPVPA